MKKRLAIFLFLALILSFSFVSAGFFENLFSGKFTGEAARDFSMQLRRTATIGDSEVTITKIEENVATVVVKDSNTGVAEEFNAIEGETLTTKSGEQLTISGVESNAFFTRRGSVGINFQPAQTPVPLPLPEKPEPPVTKTCADSDGKDYFIKGEVSGFMPNQQIGGVYLDYCSSSTTLVERFCLKARDNNDYVYDESYSCSCSDGACIENADNNNLEISIATLKDNYQVGEQIKLTDPPETGESKLTGLPIGFSRTSSDGFLKKESIKENKAVITRNLIDSTGNIYSVETKTISIPKGNDQKTFAITSGEFPSSFQREISSDLIDMVPQADADGVIVVLKEKSLIEKRNEILEKANGKLSGKRMERKLEKRLFEQKNRIEKEQEKAIEYIEQQFNSNQEKRLQVEESEKIKIISHKNAINALTITGVPVQKVTSLLKDSPEIKDVWPNVKVELALMDSVPMINADQVWGYTDTGGIALDGTGTTIGIIDTGIDYTHSDLGGCYGVGCKVVDGYDFSDLDSDPMDYMGHGTHVAATAAGDGILKGVAPGAELYAYKVFPNSYEDVIISAIERCADPNEDGDYSDRLDVCSLSLGGPGNPDDPMSTAIDVVTSAGVVFTIAAGNDGCENCIGSPGTSREAITVAAACKTADIGVDPTCNTPIASFSSRGPVVWTDQFGAQQTINKPDISAPGHKICAAQWNDAWQDSECLDTEHIAISGTSMATPHIAGVVSLIRQAHPEFTPQEVKDFLKSSSSDLGLSQNIQGAGLVDSISALSISGFPDSSIQFSGLPLSFTDSVTTTIQSFSKTITIKNTAGQTLTIIPQVPSTLPSGFSLNFDKSNIVLTDGQSSDIEINFIVNHDIVSSPFTLNEKILFNLSNGEVAQLGARIYVKNRLLTPNANKINFGLDPAGANGWTTSNYVSLKNTLTDSSTSYITSISCCTDSNGNPTDSGAVTISTDSTINFSPEQQKNLILNINANNNLLSENGRYEGKLILSSSLQNLEIPITFWKGYGIQINYSGEVPVGVNLYKSHEIDYRNQLSFFPSPNSIKNIIYTTEPGPWEISAFWWEDYEDYLISNIVLFLVNKEEIQPNTNTPVITAVNLNKNEAVNDITFNHISLDGNPAYLMYISQFMRQENGLGTGFFGWVPTGTKFKVSDLSQDYKFLFSARDISQNYGDKIIIYQDQIEGGITGDVNLVNQDMIIKDVIGFQNSLTEEEITIGNCIWGCFASYSGISLSEIPIKLYAYSNGGSTPENSLYPAYDFSAIQFIIIRQSDWARLFYSGHYYVTPQKTYSWLDAQHNLPYEKIKFQEPLEGTIIVGEGVIWDFTKWLNYANFDSFLSSSLLSQQINEPTILLPYFKGSNSHEVWFDIDDGLFSDYILKKDGGIIASGQWKPDSFGWIYPLELPRDSITGLVFPGNYSFEMTRQATINGVVTNIKTESSFQIIDWATYQSIPVDENPPALNSLNLLSNGIWQNVIDPSVTNTFEFEIDPVPGILSNNPDAQNYLDQYLYMVDSLSSVIFEISTDDGSTWSNVNLNSLSGNKYNANIPIIKGAQLYTFKISAIDLQGNTFSYTFQMPTGIAILLSSYKPQSKIVNNENFNITGNLTMKLQKKTGLQEEKRISKGGAQKFSRTTGNQISAPLESWQDVQVVTSQQVTIPANDLIKLDIGGSYGWNLKNIKADSEGDYRVYASFESNGEKIEDSWEFKVMPLGGVPVAPDAE